MVGRGGVRLAATAPLGLLSLALAVVLWVTVTNEENPSLRRPITRDIPVEQVNVPKSLLPTNVAPARVSVTVSGPRSAVNDIRPEEVTAQVDLSRADEALGSQRETTIERPVRVDVKRRGVRADVTPDVVQVTVERQERRSVPVCVDRVGAPPPGFTVDEPVLSDPVEAVITGPRRNVDAVECATAVLRLTGLTVNVSSQSPLEPRDSAGRAIGGVSVTPATATVNLRVKQSLFPREVAVEVQISGRPAPGYSVGVIRSDPAVISVVGPLDAVNLISTIPTEQIDIEGARSDIVRSVALQLPSGVSSGDRRSVVTITLQANRAPGSLGVVARIVNLGPGLVAAQTNPTVALLLSGPLPDLLALRPADVSVTLDALGLGPGIYRLEPKVIVPPGISVDSVTPDRVEVTIGPAR